MEARLPKAGLSAGRKLYRFGAEGFGSLHQFAERATLQFNQLVKMIWHYDPSQRIGQSRFLSCPELAYKHSAKEEIAEYGFSPGGIGGQKVNAVVF
ncbi:hypothetical protein BR1R3_09400 [Pseudomonas atacamensis]|nr:hypothetical protein BR1R3_09400 [Pseudomonas atacamensis]